VRGGRWAGLACVHGAVRTLLLGLAATPRPAGGMPSSCPCISKVPQRLRRAIYPNASCMLMRGPTYTGRPDEPDYCYPPDYGLGRCDAWDEALRPYCAGAGGRPRFDAPSWCTDRWCYVDKGNCQLPADRMDVTPSVVDQAATTDDQLVYSHAACDAAPNRTEPRRPAPTPAAESLPSTARPASGASSERLGPGAAVSAAAAGLLGISSRQLTGRTSPRA